jgi:pyrimidine operon attenuation protein / uracil phosphoribosyltransferase
VAASKTIGPVEIEAAITRLADAISSRHQPAESLLLLGIANGGIELARRLSAALAPYHGGNAPKHGILDISFHRDDFGRHPIPKEFAPTHIPADVHDATVILVDDVLFSGRTMKAALDELFDHGRPTKVELAVLVDRGGRRLPISADFVGFTIAAEPDEKIAVRLDSVNSRKDSIRLEPGGSAIRPSAV